MGRILIADDDADLRESLRLLLEIHGHSVDEARNGEEALRRLDGPHPNVIVLDLMMPVMDGWQFRRAQLDNPMLAGIPVVVISAVPWHLQRLAELDARRIFSKPFDYDELLSELEVLCTSTA
ncbi:MAG TPA: response regulator [Vicinamibacterales bacterium]|nr:response regulator [Vicinamibacterales bacterium]